MSRVASFGQISEITENLFLSGAHVLRPETLMVRRIGCIVNATSDAERVRCLDSVGVDYVQVRIEDARDAPLHAHFDHVADKILQVKQQRGMATLVHCVAGVSRSATLCIAYLVKHENMSLKQAYWRVKQARPIIRPNNGFWAQLVEYELKIRGKTSVTMVYSLHGYDRYDKPLPDVYAVDDHFAVDVNDWRRRFFEPMASDASATLTSTTNNNGPNGSFSMDLSDKVFKNNCHLNVYKRYSSSVNSSPRSTSLANRMTERYGSRGKKRQSTSTTFSALTLANSVIPLKAHIKASLFSSIYDIGFQSNFSDILFPIF